MNDPSLERGGLFNIYYDYVDSNGGCHERIADGWWTPPHPTHRRGTEIDIRANPLVHPDTAIPEGSFKKFEELVMGIGGTFCGGKGLNIAYPGQTKQHYHVCLLGGNCCSGGN